MSLFPGSWPRTSIRSVELISARSIWFTWSYEASPVGEKLIKNTVSSKRSLSYHRPHSSDSFIKTLDMAVRPYAGVSTSWSPVLKRALTFPKFRTGILPSFNLSRDEGSEACGVFTTLILSVQFTLTTMSDLAYLPACGQTHGQMKAATARVSQALPSFALAQPVLPCHFLLPREKQGSTGHRGMSVVRV